MNEETRTIDVYKRQKQHYHCYSLDASPGIEHHFPEQVISPEDILMEKETEREPVSYTHLDVYKRQHNELINRCSAYQDMWAAFEQSDQWKMGGVDLSLIHI